MSSLNKCQLIGNLGADPEVRYTQNNTAVATLSIATSDRYKDRDGQPVEKTEWHRVVAWAKLAEICQNYLKKGDKVYIEGPIQTREWKDKEGQKRYTTEIKALNMVMLGGNGASSSKPKQAAPAASEPSKSLEGIENENDDLPF